MKYAGSKSRIAKDIVPIIQNCINNNNISIYIEPFVGGANIIDKINCDFKYGLDKNKYLIALFQHLQNGGELLPAVSKELYSEVRANYKSGDYEDWYVGNIGFLASYNGKWFDGGYAKPVYEKTKTGEKYRDYYQEAKRNIEKQMPNLKTVTFNCSNYTDISLSDTSMIYCDPPYATGTQLSYSKGFDFTEFWNKMREWSKEHFVLISEVSAPEDFICIWEKSVNRSLNASNKKNVTEKLFIYKEGKFQEYANKVSLIK